jgi:hypothetical protein
LIRPSNYEQLNYTSSLFYVLSITPLRASILTLYYRLSPVKAYKWIIVILFVISLLHSTIGLFFVIFSCNPVPKFWDITILSGKCINRTTLSIQGAYVNIIFDFIMVVLPLPTVWRLNLPTRQKIAVSAIFMAGLA